MSTSREQSPERMDHEPRPSVIPDLRRWRLAPDAWRLAGRLTPGRLEHYLRYRSAKGLPESFKARFRAMHIPEKTISEVLEMTGKSYRLRGAGRNEPPAEDEAKPAKAPPGSEESAPEAKPAKAPFGSKRAGGSSKPAKAPPGSEAGN